MKWEIQLRADEIEYLKNCERCTVCGHLKALHNYHCCVFCMLDDCRCHDEKWSTTAESTPDLTMQPILLCSEGE